MTALGKFKIIFGSVLHLYFQRKIDYNNIQSGASKAVPIIAIGDDIGDDIDEKKKALKVFRVNPAITAKAMAKQMGVSTRKISRIVKELREDGIITRIGSDRKDYWKINQ